METIVDDKKLVSSWFNIRSVPDTYVHPPEKRPGKLNVPRCKNIPVVDLGSHDRSDTILRISKASQDFGFFQVINHGVPNKLMCDTMRVFKEFHAMPSKDKANEFSKDPSRSCKLYTSSENYANEKVHFWRDALTHPCDHPLEKYMPFWPDKPTQYREVVKAYLVEVRKMSLVIMQLLAEGLGISTEFFSGGLSESPVLLSNHYPPCPDPSLTLGLTKHRDPTLITILLQDTDGLQVFKDGNWIGVEPNSTAFVVNIGYVLQIISNAKFKGAQHRVVTNTRVARTTIAYLIYPCNESLIEPAKALSNPTPPLFRTMKFKEFLRNFKCWAANDEALLQIISLSIK